MKPKLTIAVAVATLFLLVQNANAINRIWRVNNKSNYNGSTQFGDNLGGTAAYPVFKEVNEAVASALVEDLDTIHVEPSPLVYQTANITKQLVVIGSGYFISDNPKTSNMPYNSKIQRIEFDAGSEGSKLLGMDVVVNGSSLHGYVNVEVNNITVKRCRIERSVAFQTGLVDAYIVQNFFAGAAYDALETNGSSLFVPPTDVIFNNNIVLGTLIWKNSTYQFPILQCNHNVFDGPPNALLLDFVTSEFKNNIVKPNGVTVNINNNTNANVEYVTATNPTQFPGTPGLVVEPAMTNVFITSASADGKYQLNPTWAAANPGSDGDRGAFGGPATSAYTLSGLAPIPVVYNVSTSGVATPGSGLPVTIKARTVK